MPSIFAKPSQSSGRITQDTGKESSFIDDKINGNRFNQNKEQDLADNSVLNSTQVTEQTINNSSSVSNDSLVDGNRAAFEQMFQIHTSEEQNIDSSRAADVNRKARELDKNIEILSNQVEDYKRCIDSCDEEIRKLETIKVNYKESYDLIKFADENYKAGGYISDGKSFHEDDINAILDLISNGEDLAQKSIDLIDIDKDRFQQDLKTAGNNLMEVQREKRELLLKNKDVVRNELK